MFSVFGYRLHWWFVEGTGGWFGGTISAWGACDLNHSMGQAQGAGWGQSPEKSRAWAWRTQCKGHRGQRPRDRGLAREGWNPDQGSSARRRMRLEPETQHKGQRGQRPTDTNNQQGWNQDSQTQIYGPGLEACIQSRGREAEKSKAPRKEWLDINSVRQGHGVRGAWSHVISH